MKMPEKARTLSNELDVRTMEYAGSLFCFCASFDMGELYGVGRTEY